MGKRDCWFVGKENLIKIVSYFNEHEHNDWVTIRTLANATGIGQSSLRSHCDNLTRSKFLECSNLPGRKTIIYRQLKHR